MKKKEIGILICTIIVVLFSLVLGIYNIQRFSNVNEDNDGKIVILDTKKIEYASSLTYKEFLSMLFYEENISNLENIEIIVDGKKIDETTVTNFEKLGKVNLEVSYTLNSNKQDKNIVWEVVDTKAPKLKGVRDIEIELGDELNYQDNITAEDECDSEVKVTFESEVDELKVGRYQVKVTAIDSSNNSTSEVFYVTIKDKKTTTTSTSKTTTTTKKTTTKKTTTKTTTTTKKTTAKTTTKKNDESTKSGRLALAKIEAKNVVKKIIKNGMSDAEKAQAISTYLYQNVARQMNQSNEAYKTNYGNEAYAALVMKIAACSGFCKAVTLLCDEAGLKSQHINANQWTHQWNKVYVDGKWQVLDAQIGYFGGEEHPFYG